DPYRPVALPGLRRGVRLHDGVPSRRGDARAGRPDRSRGARRPGRPQPAYRPLRGQAADDHAVAVACARPTGARPQEGVRYGSRRGEMLALQRSTRSVQAEPTNAITEPSSNTQMPLVTLA